jgi:hypothetical protein
MRSLLDMIHISINRAMKLDSCILVHGEHINCRSDFLIKWILIGLDFTFPLIEPLKLDSCILVHGGDIKQVFI